MNRWRISFHVDAGEDLGLGHLSRCRSLAVEFAQRFSLQSTFFTNNPELGREFLKGTNAVVRPSSLFHGRETFDVAIMDIPRLAEGRQTALGSNSTVRVLVNDDEPGPFSCDILLRPNLLDLPCPSLREGGECLQGGQYILLHPSFAAQEAASQPRPAVRRLLVCFGGSDPARLTDRVLPTLLRLPNEIEIEIIVGSAFPHPGRIRETISSVRNIVLAVSSARMAEAFAAADLALISGGTLMYEACASGVPALVISQNRPQKLEAEILSREGAVVDLGLPGEAGIEEIADALGSLLRSSERREQLTRAARRCIPREGTSNVARRIVSRLIRAGRAGSASDPTRPTAMEER